MQKNNSTIRVLESEPTSSPPSTTTPTGVGVPACASCRHQRKKCTQKCILAPFFPAEKTLDFQAVHKVFGVSNVTKLVKDLSQEDAKKAVESLIWEANWRLNDPVLGPYGEFQRVSEELNFYKTQYQIAAYRANVYQNHRQVPITQNAGVYNNKPAQQRFIGSWNGDHMINNNNGLMLDYIRGNGIFGGIDNSRVFNYGAMQNMGNVKEEIRDQEQQGSLIHPQLQNVYDFSQYY